MSNKKPKVCLGFPSGNGCQNKPGGAWSPYWCPDCDKRRVDHISQQLDNIQAQFKQQMQAK